jgi:hypothetical protein
MKRPYEKPVLTPFGYLQIHAAASGSPATLPDEPE